MIENNNDKIIYAGEDQLNIMEFADNYNHSILKYIMSHIGDSTESILDFGSGTGYFARKVVKEAKKNVLCVEVAGNMKKYYEKNGLDMVDNLDAVKNESCDLIYSVNVLEHIKDDKDAVDSLFKKLKKGGRIFIYVPAFQILFSKADEAVDHQRRYSKKELLALFSDFILKDCRYADSLGFAAALGLKYFGNELGAITPSSVRFYDRAIFPLSLFIDKISNGTIIGKNLILSAEKP